MIRYHRSWTGQRAGRVTVYRTDVAGLILVLECNAVCKLLIMFFKQIFLFVVHGVQVFILKLICTIIIVEHEVIVNFSNNIVIDIELQFSRYFQFISISSKWHVYSVEFGTTPKRDDFQSILRPLSKGKPTADVWMTESRANGLNEKYPQTTIFNDKNLSKIYIFWRIINTN